MNSTKPSKEERNNIPLINFRQVLETPHVNINNTKYAIFAPELHRNKMSYPNKEPAKDY